MATENKPQTANSPSKTGSEPIVEPAVKTLSPQDSGTNKPEAEQQAAQATRPVDKRTTPTPEPRKVATAVTQPVLDAANDYVNAMAQQSADDNANSADDKEENRKALARADLQSAVASNDYRLSRETTFMSDSELLAWAKKL